jgi:hypothetical protein
VSSGRANNTSCGVPKGWFHQQTEFARIPVTRSSDCETHNNKNSDWKSIFDDHSVIFQPTVMLHLPKWRACYAPTYQNNRLPTAPTILTLKSTFMFMLNEGTFGHIFVIYYPILMFDIPKWPAHFSHTHTHTHTSRCYGHFPTHSWETAVKLTCVCQMWTRRAKSIWLSADHFSAQNRTKYCLDGPWSCLGFNKMERSELVILVCRTSKSVRK